LNPETLTNQQKLEVLDYLSDALVAVGHANMKLGDPGLDAAVISIRNILDQILEWI